MDSLKKNINMNIICCLRVSGLSDSEPLNKTKMVAINKVFGCDIMHLGRLQVTRSTSSLLWSDPDKPQDDVKATEMQWGQT